MVEKGQHLRIAVNCSCRLTSDCQSRRNIPSQSDHDVLSSSRGIGSMSVPPPFNVDTFIVVQLLFQHASCRVAPEAETAALTAESEKEDVMRRNQFAKDVARSEMIVSFHLLQMSLSLLW